MSRIEQFINEENKTTWNETPYILIQSGGWANSSAPRPSLALITRATGPNGHTIRAEWFGNNWDQVKVQYYSWLLDKYDKNNPKGVAPFQRYYTNETPKAPQVISWSTFRGILEGNRYSGGVVQVDEASITTAAAKLNPRGGFWMPYWVTNTRNIYEVKTPRGTACLVGLGDISGPHLKGVKTLHTAEDLVAWLIGGADALK